MPTGANTPIWNTTANSKLGASSLAFDSALFQYVTFGNAYRIAPHEFYN